MLEKESLKKYIEEIIQEIENELDEANVTGNIDGYQTPFAFSGKGDSKKRKKVATQLGYELVGDDVENIDESINEVGVGDWHFKAIQKLYQKAGAFGKKKIAGLITKNPNSSWDKIEKVLKGSDYDEVTYYTDMLKLESVNEGMVRPRMGHKFYQLTKDAKVEVDTGRYITGKKGAYLIDYFDNIFYVDMKAKIAYNILKIKDQSDLGWKRNFVEVDKAPELKDWKGYIKESVNELASRTAVEIGGLTGMSRDFIQKFVDTHNLDIEKVFQFVKKGNLKDRMDFVTALSGKPNNPYQKKLIKMFGESVNEASLKPKKLTQLKKGEKFVFNNNPYEFIELYTDIPNAAKVKKEDGKTSVVSFGGGVVNKNTKGGFGDYLKQGGRVWDNVNKDGNSVNENRWLELKNDTSMHANKKLAVGLKELKYQLAEVEKFFNWYNKIKNINELDSDNYWKRTNNHIYKIKERLINIARTLQEIEK